MATSRSKKGPKPISLHPLSVKEALKGLLDTKPPPEARSQKMTQKQGKVSKKAENHQKARKD